MDQLVVDLHTEDDSVAPVATWVGLFGPEPGMTADEWASAAGTINCEMFTGISPRVPRIHVDTDPATDIGTPTGKGR